MSGPTENGSDTGLLRRFVPGAYGDFAALKAVVEAGTVPNIPPIPDDYGNWSGGFLTAGVNTLESLGGATALFGNDWYLASRLASNVTDLLVREVWAIKSDAFDGLTIPDSSDHALAGFFVQLDGILSDNTDAATRVSTPTKAQFTLWNFADDRVMWRSRPNGMADANPTVSEAAVRALAGTLVDIRWRATAHLGEDNKATTIDVTATVNGTSVVDDTIDSVAQEAFAWTRTGAWGSIGMGGSFMKIGLVRVEIYDPNVNADPWGTAAADPPSGTGPFGATLAPSVTSCTLS